MAELYQLQEQEIPEAMGQLRESHVNLKKVADYCEASYLQASEKERKPFLEESRRYTTQALASVAYQINTLATSFLSLLDLQANQLVEMESSINHLAQTVAIHKEKVARREIGVLTTNKNFYRPIGVKSPGIIFPEQPEKSVKYVRKPIDYTVLDTVGQGGCKNQVPHHQPQRTRSVSSDNSHNSLTKAPSDAMSNASGTLSRTNRHYAPGMSVRPPPAPIAPPVVPTVPSHYMSAQQLHMAQQTGAPINVANALYGSMQPPTSPASGPNHVISNSHSSMYNGDIAPPPPLSPPLPPMPSDNDYNQVPGTRTSDAYNFYRPKMPPPPPPPPIDNLPSPIADYPLPDYPSYDVNSSVDMYDGSEGQRVSIPPPPPNMLSNDPEWAPTNYMEKVVAIFDYEPQNDDELRFRENAVIYVINKNSDGWWEGVMEVEGQAVHGLFPENYVESLL